VSKNFFRLASARHEGQENRKGKGGEERGKGGEERGEESGGERREGEGKGRDGNGEVCFMVLGGMDAPVRVLTHFTRITDLNNRK
jgi:hypothetical protein